MLVYGGNGTWNRFDVVGLYCSCARLIMAATKRHKAYSIKWACFDAGMPPSSQLKCNNSPEAALCEDVTQNAFAYMPRAGSQPHTISLTWCSDNDMFRNGFEVFPMRGTWEY